MVITPFLDRILLSVQHRSPALIKSLLLSLLEAADYRCSMDNNIKDPGYLVHDNKGKVLFHIRFVDCPRTPIGRPFLQKLVGSMEPFRDHIVIFVLILEDEKNNTKYFTKEAEAYMEIVRNYEFLPSVTLVQKAYSM